MKKLQNSFKQKTVLIAEGTNGIGLATAFSFAEMGAKCILICHGDVINEDVILKKFDTMKADHPLIINVDPSDKKKIEELMKKLKENHERIDIFVSNIAPTSIIKDIQAYSFSDLKSSLAHGAWSIYEYIKNIKAHFNHYPRYVVAISTNGVEHYQSGYDFIAATKAAMETLCRYMSYRLRDDNVNINIIRTSIETTQQQRVSSEEVANVALALCSGLLDEMRGQIINVDRGASFFD